ncbi:MAG: hypothetical protein VYE77_07675 [Planctomycetota bacterium]|nr:hypothetical protein [Planctomycetota bacterium]
MRRPCSGSPAHSLARRAKDRERGWRQVLHGIIILMSTGLLARRQ